MKINLDDIDKKTPFDVPEGYFDQLTGKIQERVEARRPAAQIPALVLKWAAVPAFVLLVLSGIWFYTPDSSETNQAEAILTEVSDEAILAYLETSDLTITEVVSMSEAPLDLLEEDPNYLQGIDLGNENVDELLNTIDLNELYL